MKLEVGKCYEDRLGRIVGPMECGVNTKYSFSCNYECYMENGSYLDGFILDSDLVREVGITANPSNPSEEPVETNFRINWTLVKFVESLDNGNILVHFIGDSQPLELDESLDSVPF